MKALQVPEFSTYEEAAFWITLIPPISAQFA